MWQLCCSMLHCVTLCCSVLQCILRVACGDVLYVCCSALQCTVVCCSVLQLVLWEVCHLRLHHLRECGTVLQYITVCCSVLQCVAACCSVFYGWSVAQRRHLRQFTAPFVWLGKNIKDKTAEASVFGLRSHVAVCCSVLQCVAVCCSVVQRVVVWCINM